MNKKHVAILVTGSRYYAYPDRIKNRLASYDETHKIDQRILIHGGAKGADSIAATYAQRHWNVITLPALWHIHGNVAGPIRNTDMLKLLKLFSTYGYDVFVEAFPIEKSKGTIDMIKKAMVAGVKVIIASSKPQDDGAEKT